MRDDFGLRIGRALRRAFTIHHGAVIRSVLSLNGSDDDIVRSEVGR